MKSFRAVDPAFVDGFIKQCYDAMLPWETAAELLEKAACCSWLTDLLDQFHEKAAMVDTSPERIRAVNQARDADASKRDAIRLGLMQGSPQELQRLGMHRELALAKQKAQNQALVAYHNNPDPNPNGPASGVNADRDAALAAAWPTPTGPIPAAAPPPDVPVTGNIAQNPGESMRSYLDRMRAAQGMPPAKMPPQLAPGSVAIDRGFGTGSSTPAAAPVAAAPAPSAGLTPAAIPAPVAAPSQPPVEAPVGMPATVTDAPQLKMPPPKPVAAATAPPAAPSSMTPPPSAKVPPLKPAAKPPAAVAMGGKAPAPGGAPTLQLSKPPSAPGT